MTATPAKPSRAAAAIPLAVAGLLAGLAFTEVDTSVLLWSALSIVILSAVTAGLRRRASTLLSAPVLVILIVSGVIMAGSLFYPLVEGQAAVGVALSLEALDLASPIRVALIFCLAVALGSSLIPSMAGGTGFRDVVATASSQAAAHPGALLAAGIGPLLLSILARNDTLLRANYGNVGDSTGIAIIAGTLAPFAEVALALALFASRQAAVRALALLGLGGWAAVHLAIATRQLAILPLAVLLGALLVGRRPRVLWVVAAGLASLVGSTLALTLRGNPAGVGLANNLPPILSGEINLLNWQGAIGNIIFSAPLTADVMNRPNAGSASNFITSVTPLPGALAGWDDLAPRLRVNLFTPYNGLGELAAGGVPYLVAYGIAVGLALGVAGRLASRIEGTWGGVAKIALVAIAVLFAVTFLQYNLRSATRLLYYLLVLMLGLRVLAGRPTRPVRGVSRPIRAVRQ